jgi:hypothetical protein
MNILQALNNLGSDVPVMKKISRERFKKCLNMILSPIAPNHEDLADEGFLELN